jgi:hypothetical protein
MLRMSAAISASFSALPPPPTLFAFTHLKHALGQSLTSNFQFIIEQSLYHSTIQVFDIIDSVVK